MVHVTATRMTIHVIRMIINVNYYEIKTVTFGIHNIRVRLTDNKIKLISYQYFNYIKENYNGKTFTL